jgi:hypothetical protein
VSLYCSQNAKSQFFAKQSILCVKNAILWFWLCASGNFLPMCCTQLVGAKSFGTQAGRAGASQITCIGCVTPSSMFGKYFSLEFKSPHRRHVVI